MSTLPYRRAGRSGLDLSAFSFGLWQKFGTDYPDDTQREIVLRAFELGITHFDNADRYGPPHRAAQQFFGQVLKHDLAAHRQELILSTKAGNPIGASPYLKGGSRKSLLGSLEQSLRDLGTDYVDIFYSHSPDPTTPLDETVGALVSAVQQGKALYIGISNYPTERAQNSAFLSPDAIDDTYKRRVTELNKLAAQRGQSLAQLALQWVLRRPEVTSAIVGASSTWQLDHNVKALDFPPLTDEELTIIDASSGDSDG